MGIYRLAFGLSVVAMRGDAFVPPSGCRPMSRTFFPSISSFWGHRPNTSVRRGELRMAPGAHFAPSLVDHLERDMMADLAVLAKKFGRMVTSIEDIEHLRVCDIDGDHMDLEVVYCDKEENSCVALQVPIDFPHHCDTEAEVDKVIHELEHMAPADGTWAEEIRLKKPPLSPELQETISRISQVMNLDFQTDLQRLFRRFGATAVPPGRGLGRCEMLDLTPDGFDIVATLEGSGDARVHVAFSRECLSGRDFQNQILELSEQSMC